jgi:hypothetical protein
VGVQRLARDLAEVLIGQRPSRETDDGRLGRQQSGAAEVVDGGQDLARGQVAGRAEDDDRARLRHALQEQSRTEWILSRRLLAPMQVD